ncbi:MAG: methyltransferase domain-containing protein, partial [Candidatus Lokiarchaeota archaeon]|nr:methyltransferase domain-containing protein [Candidatus Lokiarchaeota archaeon]
MARFITDYDDIAINYNHKRRKPWKYFLDFLEELNQLEIGTTLNTGGIVCDLGCGTGRHTQIILSKSDVYIGIDLSFKMLEIAKSNLEKTIKIKSVNSNWVACDVENLPFRENSFSNIYSIAVIHHIISKKHRQLFYS